MKNTEHSEFTHNEFYCVVASVDRANQSRESQAHYTQLLGKAGVCWEQLAVSPDAPLDGYSLSSGTMRGRTLYSVSLHDHGETEHFLDGEILRISKAQFNTLNDINSRRDDRWRSEAWSNENPF
jgi:hypothetical protein